MTLFQRKTDRVYVCEICYQNVENAVMLKGKETSLGYESVLLCDDCVTQAYQVIQDA